MRGTLLLTICGALLGCGAPTIKPLSLKDTRLPAAARRAVADAQDTLFIARARLNEARQRKAAAERAAEQGSSLPPAVAGELEGLNAARLTQANLELRLAEEEMALAEIRLQLGYARTATRYDVEVYELAPIERQVEAVAAKASATRKEVQRGRIDLEERATAWWKAWRAHAQAKGDTSGYWKGEAGL